MEQQTGSIGKGIHQGCILSPCLFSLHAEYIMRNTRLEEAQAGIKIAGRNINNLRYADDTTLMAESEEELKSLSMTVKEESEKVGLKLYIQKTNIMAPGPITSWEIDGETVETVADFIFWPFLLFSGWSPGAQDAAGQAPGCAWNPVVGLENHLSAFPERELVRAASYTEALIRILPITFS